MMRASRVAVVVLVGTMGLGIVACKQEDGASNAGDNAGAAQESPQPGSVPEAKSDILQIENAGLPNPIDPCFYMALDKAWPITNPAAEKIYLNTDRYSYDGVQPIRQCKSYGDSGAGLTGTTLFDPPGDDIGYNAVATLFPEQEELNAVEIGVQKGFIILEDGEPVGAVFKTVRDAVVVIKFGMPVTSRQGLIDMIIAPVKIEDMFFTVEEEYTERYGSN